ncbi:MAG: helix-turn-helix domain-containing protein [Niabella sp.]
MEAVILSKDQYTELVARLDEITTRLNTKNEPKKDTFLDNQEFLQLMKISKRTAQTWRDEGRISFSQVGNKIYYKLSDVEKLLQEHYNKAFAKK